MHGTCAIVVPDNWVRFGPLAAHRVSAAVNSKHVVTMAGFASEVGQDIRSRHRLGFDEGRESAFEAGRVAGAGAGSQGGRGEEGPRASHLL